MECEMCGSQTATRRYRVDSGIMSLGLCCGKYGVLVDTPRPAAPGPQGLERREKRMTSKSVYDQDQLDLVEDFGKRIRQARERKGWNFQQLGERVSARVPEIHKIEAGSLRPSDRLAKALERQLGITLFEKVSADSTVSGVNKPAGRGLTIGDILKDAKDK